jgi:2-polyprenyl-6-methoxyphenol hydroxylase-like FAD-dependent oxidoreductase
VKTPVLIAGGGPIGLALAGDLGWRGIPCVVVEKGDGSVGLPKMDLLGIRTMELCRRWGIVDWVENSGYNRDHPQDCAWVTSMTGYELGREPFPTPRAEQCPPQSPQKRYRAPQNFFDPVLARFARQFPQVDVRYGTELVDFAEGPDGVSATVVDRASGRKELIDSDYLVGCDGGSSLVRERLGIGASGVPVLTHTTNAIFRAPSFWKLSKVRPGYRFIFIGPEGTWSTVVAIDGYDRYRFSNVGDAMNRALTDEEMRAGIARAMGRPFDFELLSVSPWVRRQLVADSYGTKRVFLAGDSAHLMSPTGAFGMNTGMQDAVDLGWKLEAVIRGWGGPKLLASYGTERKPVAVRNVAEATGNLKRMISTRDRRPPPEIFGPGTKGDAARAEYGANYTAMMKREWFSIGIHLGFFYEGSPLVVPDGTPPPPDEVMSYAQTARPGSRAPHAWLAPGRSTLDLFGRGFVLLRFGSKPPDGTALKEAAAARGVPFSVVDIAGDEAARLYERRLVLVRPDGHVAWRGDEPPREAGRLLDTVRGGS